MGEARCKDEGIVGKAMINFYTAHSDFQVDVDLSRFGFSIHLFW